MKKVLFKSVIVSFGLLGLLYIGGIQVFAVEESAGADLVNLVKEDAKSSEAEFDLNQTLQQVQLKIENKIKEELGVEFDNQLDKEYFKILQGLDTGTLILSESEVENTTFSEFSGIYLSRIAAILPEDATQDELSVVNKEKDLLLARTFSDIKAENINMILETGNATPTRSARAAFNVSKATSYAKTWWNRRNMLFPVFSSDCTNFASQIAFYGGKPLRNSPNASGMTWTHNAGVNASSPWMLAHNFIVFWTADGVSNRQFNSKADAQAYTREGDFIGYWKKNTFQITHVAYVSKKSGATAYITQHTTDRVDTSWNSINTNDYSSFVVIRL